MSGAKGGESLDFILFSGCTGRARPRRGRTAKLRDRSLCPSGPPRPCARRRPPRLQPEPAPYPQPKRRPRLPRPSDRKSTRLNSSHTVIYTLSLHDALPISLRTSAAVRQAAAATASARAGPLSAAKAKASVAEAFRSEEHTSELQSHRDLHSFPTRRSSDLPQDLRGRAPGGGRHGFSQSRPLIRSQSEGLGCRGL